MRWRAVDLDGLSMIIGALVSLAGALVYVSKGVTNILARSVDRQIEKLEEIKAELEALRAEVASLAKTLNHVMSQVEEARKDVRKLERSLRGR